MDLANRRVLVVGLGKTGEAASGFLLDRGARVTITEKKSEAELGRRAEAWRERGAILETGGHTRRTFLETDLIVPSPGVPPGPEFLAAIERGIPVLSEIDLAYRFLKGRIVGVTGTNGKSTTTTLIHKILKESGRKAYLAGNIGTPLISFVGRSREDHVYVTEISSFQLEYIETFRAATAVFLNVSPNHLDWHPSLASYLEAKKKILAGQRPEDAAVLNRDDAAVWSLAEEAPAEVWGFSRRRPVRKGALLKDGWIVVRDGRQETRILPVTDIRLRGLHNLENVLAAALTAHLEGAPAGRIRASIKSFRGLEHRLEPVLTIRGVEFVNDSKATTIDATLKALASFDRPVVLILGGKDKGSDFAPLRRAVAKKVRKVILVGAAKDKIRRALDGAVPMEEARAFSEVVPLAFAAASPGDVVLLAPACTSWDMFRNFEERGRTFKRAARRLAAKLRRGRG